MSLTTTSLLSLTKTCLDLLSDMEKEKIEFKKSIKTSLTDCKSLLQIVQKHDSKKLRLVTRMRPFFDANYDSFCKPYYFVENGEKVPDTTFYSAVGKPKSENVFRGISVVPNDSDCSVCIPFSEIYELAIDLDERNHDSYGMYVPRLVHRLLSTVSTFEFSGKYTDDIDLIIAKLEEEAEITDIDLGNLQNLNIDPNMAKDLMKDFGNSDQMNDIIGSVGGIIEKIKDGGLMNVISTLGMGAAGTEIAGSADDQE